MVSRKTALSKTEKKDMSLESLIKGKQPVVHSTFRLSHEAQSAIKHLSDSLGFKNAELFERLLILFEGLEKTKNPISLMEANGKTKGIRKTYIVKKETLSKLSKLAKAKNATRDLLIEKASLAFKNMLEETLSDKKERYRAILEKTINPFWSKAEDMERKLSDELGSDDPIVKRIGYIVILAMNLSMAIENYVKNDTPIDPDDFSQQ